MSFDIVGALLVAVEAVKLENIRAFRDRILVPVERSLRPVRIEWVDGKGYLEPRSDWFGRRVLGPGLSWFVFHGLLAAACMVLIHVTLRPFGVDLLDSAYGTYSGWFEPASIWLKALLALGAAFIVLFVVVGLGEPAHQALIRAVALAVRLLTFIDRKTPNGTVGLIGAALLVLGFSLQIVGAVASGA